MLLTVSYHTQTQTAKLFLSERIKDNEVVQRGYEIDDEQLWPLTLSCQMLDVQITVEATYELGKNSFDVSINSLSYVKYIYKSASTTSYGALSGQIIINGCKILDGLMPLPWQIFTF